MHIPGLKVIIPATPRDAKGLLTSAIFDDDPCLVLETIRLQAQRGSVPLDPSFSIPLGQAEVKRPGTDVTVVTYGRGLVESLNAAAALDAEGVSVEVLDLRTLVPMDVPLLLESCARTRRAVVVHDAVQFAGPGAEIAAIVHEELFDVLEAPVQRVGARFVPNPGSAALEAQVYPSVDRIVSAVRRALGKSTVEASRDV